MISHLRGTVLHKALRYAVIEVGGVGYKVFATSVVLDTLTIEKEASLWTHLAIREDAHDLYGFADIESLSFFELLISISGIGPRTALNVLNIVTPKTLRQAVSSGDTSYLTKVSGIGRKIADKIVIELKGKFEAEEGGFTSEHMKGDADAIEALKSLGYPERDARDALKKISSEAGHKDIKAGEKVKRALKVLGGGGK